MIAVDTNVVLRRLLQDDAAQSINARGEPYEGTYTFDQPAQRLAGTKSP